MAAMSRSVMTCRVCSRERRLIKAHVIPESLYGPMRAEGNSPMLVSTGTQEHSKRRPIGTYDTTILCGECEQLFQDVDDFAPSFFLAEPPEGSAITAPTGEVVGHSISGIDNRLLKLFVMSVLWRAAVSSDIFFFHVTLGPFEPVLRKFVAASDPGDVDNFSVILSRYDDALSSHILNVPHPRRIDGINLVTLYFGSYLAEVKVDSRPLPEPYRSRAIRPTGPIVVQVEEFASSHAREVATMTSRADRVRRNRKRRRG